MFAGGSGSDDLASGEVLLLVFHGFSDFGATVYSGSLRFGSDFESVSVKAVARCGFYVSELAAAQLFQV